jgi:1-acyl-sn-glycerol-3-phosphate acyltransferase
MIRRLLFYIGYMPSMVLFATLTGTIGWLLPFRLRMEMGTLWNAFIVYFWLPLVTGHRAQIEGSENIPEQPVVVMANHQSEWETLSLIRIFRPTSVVLKKSLLSIPFFGWGLRAVRPIPIDRSNPREAIRQISKTGILRLRQGNNVLIFPEGTRLPPGKIGSYKRAAAKLAIEAGVPVVPVVHNAGECWLRGGYFTDAVIRVRIGKPISTAGREADELTREIQQWAEKNLLELSNQ